jgi:hypothetical protein
MEQLEKQPLGRPTELCNNNSTMYIMKTGFDGQSWLELAQNIQRWVLSVALKRWHFLRTHTTNFFTTMTPLHYLPPS